MSGFQRSVNTDPAPAIEGDFASANPRASLLAGAGELTAGAVGVTVGRFAWAKNSDGTVTNAYPGGAGVVARLGFVHRNQPAVITAWLGEATMLVNPGLEITLFDMGDFWARFAAGATPGQKVFANYADGTAVAGTAGTAPNGTAVTANTTNGSANLTVTSGTLYPGQPISGTGIPANTYIVSGPVAGVYVMSANATADGTGVTVTPKAAKETQFYVHSTAGNAELAMISDRPVIS